LHPLAQLINRRRIDLSDPIDKHTIIYIIGYTIYQPHIFPMMIVEDFGDNQRDMIPFFTEPGKRTEPQLT
jgi:hypothetical protein